MATDLFTIAAGFPTRTSLATPLKKAADEALADGKVRQAPDSAETRSTLARIRTYLASLNPPHALKSKTANGVVFWQVLKTPPRTRKQS